MDWHKYQLTIEYVYFAATIEIDGALISYTINWITGQTEMLVLQSSHPFWWARSGNEFDTTGKYDSMLLSCSQSFDLNRSGGVRHG